jgi:hypothetical protein
MTLYNYDRRTQNYDLASQFTPLRRLRTVMPE